MNRRNTALSSAIAFTLVLGLGVAARAESEATVSIWTQRFNERSGQHRFLVTAYTDGPQPNFLQTAMALGKAVWLMGTNCEGLTSWDFKGEAQISGQGPKKNVLEIGMKKCKDTWPYGKIESLK